MCTHMKHKENEEICLSLPKAEWVFIAAYNLFIIIENAMKYAMCMCVGCIFIQQIKHIAYTYLPENMKTPSWKKQERKQMNN